MSKKNVIKNQIKAVQRIGKVNMCDSTAVERSARQLGFTELADFSTSDEYVTFIFTGDESILPELGENMLHIKFRYRDRFTMLGKWSEQECITSSLRECIKFYGLDQPDVEYRIVSVEEVA